MGKTAFYSMAFFDHGDELDEALNVQKEIDRFVLIDSQLFGLYNVFGNGVIGGWIVEDNGFSIENGISIRVTPGTGIIGFIASETSFPSILENLAPNSQFSVYATLVGDTPLDRFVDFTVTNGELPSDYSVKVAEISTGDGLVVSIDNEKRDRIGFEEIIREEIEAHKHRGTPSKIDLASETRNQLPGARIADIDASKLTTGRFSIEQIPLIDHNDLANSGQLTHAQLDSFVQSISESNKELLGEVASVNLLKQILFLKYNDADVDQHFINELAIIPGVSPNDFIDFEASTAQINLSSKCISGKPPGRGEFLSIVWNNNIAFENSFKQTNVKVIGDTVVLNIDSESVDVIEDFENSVGGSPIVGFNKDTIIVSDSLNLIAENSSTLKTQGFFSGKFNSKREFRAVYKKEFSSVRDWRGYDTLFLSVKSISVSHGAVYGYFINGEGQQSDIFLILAEDEETTSEDSSLNNFEVRQIDISSMIRDSVSEFVIFTDDITSGFEFYLDDIYVKNTSLFKPQGTIRFRYSSSAPITFHSVFYDISSADGTSFYVRAKVANSASLLNRASFTPGLSSGSVFAIPGTHGEIEVTLLSNGSLESTPTINSITLRVLASTDHHGFSVTSSEDWALGTTRNITIDDSSPAQIDISLPINVGGTSFGFAEAVREIDDNKVGVFGFSGSNLPISPVQATNWTKVPFRRFNNLVSVSRSIDKTYLVCDMGNDRVLLLDENGALIKGFGSVNASVSKDDIFFPLCCNYNPDSQILTIVLSSPVASSDVDLSKIILVKNGTDIPLTSTDSVKDNSVKNSQIVEILLSDGKASILSGVVSNLYVKFKANAFPSKIKYTAESSALVGINGMTVDVADFTYIDGINHPVSASVLSSGNWVVANSSIKYIPEEVAEAEDSEKPAEKKPAEEEKEEEEAIAPSIIEFDPSNQDVVFSSSVVGFSDFSLGGIVEITDDRLLIGGISSDEGVVGNVAEADDEEDTPTTEVPSSGSDVFDRIDFRNQAKIKLKKYRGLVVIVEKDSGRMVFKYVSPDGLYVSDVDLQSDGSYVVAESSFAAIAGRVVVLDSYGNISNVIGEGVMTVINDARHLSSGNYLLSV